MPTDDVRETVLVNSVKQCFKEHRELSAEREVLYELLREASSWLAVWVHGLNAGPKVEACLGKIDAALQRKATTLAAIERVRTTNKEDNT